jgi:hypothetical protein
MGLMRRLLGLSLAVALSGSLAACSTTSGGTESTTTSSGLSSTTSSATRPVDTTTTTSSSAQQVQYGGVSVTVTYTPDSGPPGTHVLVAGSGFVGDAGTIAQQDAYRFNLFSDADLPTCELIAAPSDASITVSLSGSLSGSFTVPNTGGCFQQTSTRPLAPGRYQVLLGGHTAELGTFTVTS